MAEKLTTAEAVLKAASAYKQAMDEEVIPVDFSEVNVRAQMATALGVDPEDVEVKQEMYGLSSFGVGQVYTVDAEGIEYSVIEDEDQAENLATKSVLHDLADEPETFLGDWAFDFIDEARAESFFREVYNEWNYSYVEDIQSEEDSTREYANRLVEEIVSMGLVPQEEARAEDFDPADHIDDFVESRTDGQINEGRGGYDHYEFNFGPEEAKKILTENNLIDLDAAAEYAVRTDGWASTLSRYDGDYNVTSDGFVYWRE